jgi:hypothetical protein
VPSDLDVSGVMRRNALVAASTLAVVVAVPPLRRPTRREALALGFAVAAALGLATDWDIIEHGLPLLVGAVLLAAPDRRWTHGLAALALGSAVLTGAGRDRARYVGDFYTDAPLEQRDDGVFSGLSAAPAWWATVDEVRRATDTLAPTARVFLGPRLELLYPEIRRAPLIGLPVWWHAGASYPRATKAKIVEAFIAAPPDVAIFRLGDRARVPRAIVAAVEGEYVRAGGYSSIEVWSR